MKKFLTLTCIIVAFFFFLEINCFSDDAQILETVKLEHFKISTDAEGKWYYSVKITNTGLKICYPAFSIKIFKNDELFDEHTLSKLFQGSTGRADQTSNSITIDKFFKNRVKEAEFRCVLLFEDTNIEDAMAAPEFKSVHINYKGKIVVDSYSVEEKTYTAILKNNSKYILDIGIVALELCNGQMIYKSSSFKILKPDETAAFKNDRGTKDEGCTGVLLKLIDHNAKIGSDLIFSRTYQY